MPDDDDVLTVEEVALYLRVHYNTVYKLIRDGKLKASRVGRQYRIEMEDLQRCLHQ